MKDTKFTPGPWELQRDSGLHIYIAQPQNTANRQPGYYAEVRRFTSNQDMVEANAHLIAAAPDLYEALELALKQISELDEMLNHHNHNVVGWHLNGNHEPVTTFFDETDHDALTVGGKALAKARGETQPKTGNQQ